MLFAGSFPAAMRRRLTGVVFQYLLRLQDQVVQQIGGFLCFGCFRFDHQGTEGM